MQHLREARVQILAAPLESIPSLFTVLIPSSEKRERAATRSLASDIVQSSKFANLLILIFGDVLLPGTKTRQKNLPPDSANDNH